MLAFSINLRFLAKIELAFVAYSVRYSSAFSYISGKDIRQSYPVSSRITDLKKAGYPVCKYADLNHARSPETKDIWPVPRFFSNSDPLLGSRTLKKQWTLPYTYIVNFHEEAGTGTAGLLLNQI